MLLFFAHFLSFSRSTEYVRDNDKLNLRFNSHCYAYEANEFEDDSFAYIMKTDTTVSIKCPMQSQNTEITIPETVDHKNVTFLVVALQDGSFSNLENLTTVFLPDTIETLGEKTFEDCHKLTNIKIPNHITKIPFSCFANCVALESIIFSGNITEISEYAFFNCTLLRYITLPKDLVSLGQYSFAFCNRIGPNIEIPDSISAVPSGCFYFCNGIETLRAGQKTTSLNDYSFFGCSTLSKIDFGASILTLGDFAFAYTGVKRVGGFSLGLWNIGANCFRNCQELEYVDINQTSILVLHANMFLGCQKLSAIYLPKELTVIENSGFKQCTNLKSIILPDTVREIGEFAFMQCTRLSDITFGSGLKQIGQSAFALCSKLSIPSHFPEHLVEIGSYAFANCLVKSESVSLPGTLTKIGNNPFKMSSIENIKVRENNTHFYSSQNVLYSINDHKTISYATYSPQETIKVSDDVKKIGIDTFYNSISLKSVEFPHSLESIEAGALANVLFLQEVKFPQKLQSISGEAFEYCMDLKGILEIPASVSFIGICAFSSTGIEGFDVSLDNKCYFSENGVLFERKTMKLVQFPNGNANYTNYIVPKNILRLGYMSFAQNSHLQTVILPDSLMEIEDYAFLSTHIHQVQLNEKLRAIGKSAFSQITGLTEVKIPQSVQTISDTAFSNTPLETIEFVDCYVSLGKDVFDMSQIKCILLPDKCNGTKTWEVFPSDKINNAECFSTNTPTSPASTSQVPSNPSDAQLLVFLAVGFLTVCVVVVASFLGYKKCKDKKKDPNIIESWVYGDPASIDYYTNK
ncbi:hypothetical protein TRFO_12973 [Tritrichomonas foetus]|uniref:Surface antigen BspA-like n=1 Tax=Tritrichomonas foetus TaxID=1144522 RepID=A0A1J4KZY3_9EUKA|nr:hypothetical protein TRFO_12973 [Tritrichomonas foetus]|eukprot:OHT16714.1 hypothetical protein TRFO_12973 [Tritrichomonas foetus]